MKRSIALVFVVALAAGVAASSQARNRTAPRAKAAAAGLQLTYKKWFAPGFPNMTGVVGGDIAGTFGGAVLQVTPDSSGRYLQIKAIYIVVANDPSMSFTAHVEGTADNQKGTADLDGRVVDGYLKGAQVHAHYTVVSCTESPDGTCYQGTITVKRGF